MFSLQNGFIFSIKYNHLIIVQNYWCLDKTTTTTTTNRSLEKNLKNRGTSEAFERKNVYKTSVKLPCRPHSQVWVVTVDQNVQNI
jgi:hypothetical protein